MRKRVEATLAVFLILSCVGLRLAYTAHRTSPEESVDLITIDALAPLDSQERPAVRFPHDLHVAATDEGASCLACHDPAPGDSPGISFALKNRQGLSGLAVQDFYHDHCIGCHAEREATGESTGPQVCSGCHVKHAPNPSSMSHAIDFDARLHVRHTDDAALDCQTCHDALASSQGRDDTAQASHALCITCHLDIATSDAPLDCTGCHAKPLSSSDSGELPAMAAYGGEVAFDHDLHEESVISCDICHHKEPDTGCAECHTRGGSPEGDGVTLQTAMHSLDAERSCIGCHDTMGAGVVDDCTGCHAPFGTEPR
ncbi:cytochrome c3 family protein [Desulfoluna spongiiphila]|uniref:cytochrome c3 family protein n=1 Tax=Desulfoluna spongiiphila TaxID=419481 RepID=UPI001255A822|nr:cytochrome c3 family protein [Desulfoluna spongiiphila]VVS95679.1 multihaem cytochrome [Desulfoluna spongiiphila]